MLLGYNEKLKTREAEKERVTCRRKIPAISSWQFCRFNVRRYDCTVILVLYIYNQKLQNKR